MNEQQTNNNTLSLFPLSLSSSALSEVLYNEDDDAYSSIDAATPDMSKKWILES